jgi:hypothetical protein
MPDGYGYCLGMNLHAVKAGCSVACLEWSGRGEEKIPETHPAKEARGGQEPGRKSPRLLSEERHARD